MTVPPAAEDQNGEELIAMLRDKTSYGPSRMGLVDGLRRFGDRERLVAECRWMIRDPDLVWPTLQLIGRRKLIELIDDVRDVTPSLERGDFRQLARRTLAKLEKALENAAADNADRGRREG